jgi:hypothetical protein
MMAYQLARLDVPCLLAEQYVLIATFFKMLNDNLDFNIELCIPRNGPRWTSLMVYPTVLYIG